jgi:RNA polymerase sigma factor (sigma-70 family)
MPTGQDVVDLVDQHIDFALRLARTWGNDYPWLADDFTSEAGLALFRAAKTHDPARGAFGALVRVAVRSACWARLKKERSRNPTAFKSQSVVQGEDREQIPLIEILAEDLPPLGIELEALDLLDQLPANRRELVERVVMRDESLADLAEDLGICRSTVGQRVRSILDQLAASAE